MLTYQTFITGYSNPDGAEVAHARSLKEIKSSLINQCEQAQRYGAGYEDYDGTVGEANVFNGAINDATDQYPDYQISVYEYRGSLVAKHSRC